MHVWDTEHFFTCRYVTKLLNPSKVIIITCVLLIPILSADSSPNMSYVSDRLCLGSCFVTWELFSQQTQTLTCQLKYFIPVCIYFTARQTSYSQHRFPENPSCLYCKHDAVAQHWILQMTHSPHRQWPWSLISFKWSHNITHSPYWFSTLCKHSWNALAFCTPLYFKRHFLGHSQLALIRIVNSMFPLLK